MGHDINIVQCLGNVQVLGNTSLHHPFAGCSKFYGSFTATAFFILIAHPLRTQGKIIGKGLHFFHYIAERRAITMLFYKKIGIFNIFIGYGTRLVFEHPEILAPDNTLTEKI